MKQHEPSEISSGASPLSSDTVDSSFVLFLFSAAFLMLASIASPSWAVATGAAALLLGVTGVVSRRFREITVVALVRIAGLTGLAIFAISSSTQWILIPGLETVDYLMWMGPPVLIAGVGVVKPRLISRPRARRALSVVLLLSVGLSGFAVALTHQSERIGLDVYLSHIAAAEAIADGENPYTSAVRVPDGSPNADDGAVIDGYSYPPVALVGYLGADLVFGDPRWLNVICGVVLAGALAWKSRTNGGQAPFVFLMLVALNPTWRLIVYSGWTEPLSVILVAFGLTLWKTRRLLGTVSLGLGLASKQYLILLLPILLLVRWVRRGWRLPAVVAVAVGTLAPFAFWDPGALFRTLIERPLSLSVRPDTQSLMGALGAENSALFAVVGILLGLLVSLAVARRANQPSTTIVGAGLVLAALFGSTQAYPNYWYAASMLVLLGAGTRSGQEPTAAFEQ